MNNNIKETTSLVFVQGKNLYNKNSNFGNVLIDGNGVATANNVWTCSNNIKVKGNTEYTLSWTNINSGQQPQIEICEYKEDGTFIGNIFQTLNAGVIFYTMTLNSNTDFVKVAYRNDRQDNVQFEQGPATPYQLYVEKQIHIKNKNGVFEKFYSEDNLNHENYSLGEQKIGTWMGKPLYRKTVQVTNTSFVAGNNNIPHNIDNLKLCIKVEAVKNNSVIVPYINLTNDNKINTATFVTGVDSTNIILRIANDSWGTSNTWYFTLYYTKITD